MIVSVLVTLRSKVVTQSHSFLAFHLGFDVLDWPRFETQNFKLLRKNEKDGKT
jgi:hypothetical protein